MSLRGCWKFSVWNTFQNFTKSPNSLYYFLIPCFLFTAFFFYFSLALGQFCIRHRFYAIIRMNKSFAEYIQFILYMVSKVVYTICISSIRRIIVRIFKVFAKQRISQLWIMNEQNKVKSNWNYREERLESFYHIT